MSRKRLADTIGGGGGSGGGGGRTILPLKVVKTAKGVKVKGRPPQSAMSRLPAARRDVSLKGRTLPGMAKPRTKTSAPGRSGIEAPRTKASATTKAKAVLKKMAAERSGSTYKRITPERAKAEVARERMELKHAKKRQHEMRDKIKPHKVPMKNADPRTPKQRQADKATYSSPAIQNRRKAILKAQNTLKKLKQGKTVLRRNNE